jgi:hypothetical protein
VVDERPEHPDFAGEPSIDGKTFTRHKLDEIPEDVKSNIPDDVLDDFFEEYGKDSIESWLNGYFYKIKQVVIEGSNVLED